jgi:hypothetical protein
MSDLAREFLTRTLTAAGGVVEEATGGLEALLPVAAAARMGLSEELRIHLTAVEPSAGEHTLDGRIGSALIERLVAARLGVPPMAALAYPPALPIPLPERWPVLHNAVRAGHPQHRRAADRYLSLELRVVLHSEELRTALVPVTLRLEDGARTVPFPTSGAYPVTRAPLDQRERELVARAVGSWLQREAPALHAVALESLRRRARRDLERMADYYASLDAEMAKAARRARSADERARRQAKWASLAADLATRREQLRVRMQPRLTAQLLAATLIESDVERFEFVVRRRTREGVVTVQSRMADGAIEGPACAACGVATLSLYLCDERLHVLCESCGHAGKLDRSRCRACRGEVPEPRFVSVEDPTARLRLGPDRDS